MGILDKVLGRRVRNAANIATEIAVQEEAILVSQKKIEQAQLARKAAIEDFDDARHKAADDDMAAAHRDIERREAALQALRAAHVERVDLEAREQLHREYEAERKAARELDERISEYIAAAKTIANFCRDGSAAAHRRDVLLKRARALGEQAEYYGIKAENLAWYVGDLPYGDRPGLFHCARTS